MAQDVWMVWMCCGVVPMLFGWFLSIPSLQHHLENFFVTCYNSVCRYITRNMLDHHVASLSEQHTAPFFCHDTQSMHVKKQLCLWVRVVTQTWAKLHHFISESLPLFMTIHSKWISSTTNLWLSNLPSVCHSRLWVHGLQEQEVSSYVSYHSCFNFANECTGCTNTIWAVLLPVLFILILHGFVVCSSLSLNWYTAMDVRVFEHAHFKFTYGKWSVGAKKIKQTSKHTHTHAMQSH